jgi:hypothetical protein
MARLNPASSRSLVAVWTIVLVGSLATGAVASPVHSRPGISAHHITTLSTIGAPPWTSYTGLTVQKGALFKFVVHMAGEIPSKPITFGDAVVAWDIAIDTNNSTAPSGWPTARHTQGGPNPAEYLVQLWWDGTNFGATVANRTPLLSNGTAVLTSVHFQIDGRSISFWVSPALLGDPSHFGFLADFEVYHDPVVSIAPHNKVVRLPGTDRVFVGVQNAPFDPPACAYNDTVVLPSQNSRGGNCWASWSQSVDHHRMVVAQGAPAWATLLRSTVSETKNLSVDWLMSGDVPAKPVIVGDKTILWAEFLTSLNGTAVITGWPFPVGFAFWNVTYSIIVAWDGFHYGAAVVNSTPTIIGGSPIVTPIPFQIHDQLVSVSFPSSLVADTPLLGSSPSLHSFYFTRGNTAQTVKIDSHGHIVLLNGSLMWEILTEPFCAPVGFDTCPQ